MACQMLSGSSPCWHPSIHQYGHYHSVICRIHWTVYSLSPLSSQPSPMNISHVSLFRCLDPKFKGSFYSSLSLISPHLFFSVSLIISIFKIGPKPTIIQLCYSFFSQSNSLFAFSWIVATSSNLTLSSHSCPPLIFSVSKSLCDFKGAGERQKERERKRENKPDRTTVFGKRRKKGSGNSTARSVKQFIYINNIYDKDIYIFVCERMCSHLIVSFHLKPLFSFRAITKLIKESMIAYYC